MGSVLKKTKRKNKDRRVAKGYRQGEEINYDETCVRVARVKL